MHKYLDIYNKIKNKIANNHYPIHSYLPSENSLASAHNTTKETIRKALNLLVDEGYIQKIPRKGNLVLDKKYTLSATKLSSYKDFQASQKKPNLNSETVVYDFNDVVCPKELKQVLNLGYSPKMHYIARKRKIKGETIIIDKDYIIQEIVPFLTKEIAQNSIYEYIEDRLNLIISYAQKEITVESITDEDKEHMTLNDDTHLVVVRSKVYLEDGRLFQYNEARHRIDKFKIFEFARRKKTTSKV